MNILKDIEMGGEIAVKTKRSLINSINLKYIQMTEKERNGQYTENTKELL